MDGTGWQKREAAAPLALGLRLRALRAGAGLTLGALAEASGVSLSYISDIERGRRLPALDALDRLCWALGLSVAQALDGVYPYGADRPPKGLAPPPDGRTTRGAAGR